MINSKPLSPGFTREDELRLRYLDNKEYQSKFLLDPDIQLGEDYKHLDKNLAITNLKHNEKQGINEPEQARAILRGLHVLNNPKHFNEEEIVTLTGYKEEKTKTGAILQIPVYRKVKVFIPKFPKTYHSLRSEFISFVNTAAARGGFRMNSAISNRLIKEETIADKTEVKSRFRVQKAKETT